MDVGIWFDVAVLRLVGALLTGLFGISEEVEMERRRAVLLLAGATVGGGNVLQAISMQGQEASQSHIAWVTEVLTRIETIQPGMTRKVLLTIFTTEGGLCAALRRTLLSRDCPYFKVDVEFQAIGRADRDAVLVEGEEDVILKISRPYLQFGHSD